MPLKKDHLYVGIQFTLFLVFVVEIQEFQLQLSTWLRLLGLMIGMLGGLILILAIFQLNKNLSPFPNPVADGELIQNGLYKFVRHPIYTAIILGAGGGSLFKESGWKLIVTISLLILFYFKSKYEETLLLTRFDQYRNYMKKTGRFLPGL